MANVVLGAAVNFGFSGTVLSATYFTGKIILQSASLSPTAEEEQIKDGTGALKVRTFFNPGSKASLEYVVSGTNLAGAITNSIPGVTGAVPLPGTIVNITGCSSQTGLEKTNWVVVGEPVVNHSNVGAAKVSLSIEAHDGITAVVS